MEGGGEGRGGSGRTEGEVVMVKRLIIALQLSRIRILVGGGGKTFNRVRVSLRHSGQTVNKMSAVRQRADGRSITTLKVVTFAWCLAGNVTLRLDVHSFATLIIIKIKTLKSSNNVSVPLS